MEYPVLRIDAATVTSGGWRWDEVTKAGYVECRNTYDRDALLHDLIEQGFISDATGLLIVNSLYKGSLLEVKQDGQPILAVNAHRPLIPAHKVAYDMDRYLTIMRWLDRRPTKVMKLWKIQAMASDRYANGNL